MVRGGTLFASAALFANLATKEVSSSNFFSKAAFFSRNSSTSELDGDIGAWCEGVFEEDCVDHDRHHHIDSSVWLASLSFCRHHNTQPDDGDGDWRCFKCAGDAANMVSKRDLIVSRLLILVIGEDHSDLSCVVGNASLQCYRDSKPSIGHSLGRRHQFCPTFVKNDVRLQSSRSSRSTNFHR